MSNRKLLVSSEVQAALLNQFLLSEIQDGFWKGQRPSTHGSAWTGVEVVVSNTNQVGPAGDWKPLRFYDFLNPEFTKIHEARLVQIAQTIKPNLKFKSLKKELIELARIIGGRMTDKSKEPARVYRGNNRADFDVIRVVEKQKVVTVAGAAVVAPVAVKRTAVKVKTGEASLAKKSPKNVIDADKNVEIVKTSQGATVRRVKVMSSSAESRELRGSSAVAM